MTYARARLWLGISGVGTMLVVSTAMLVTQIPQRLFPQTDSWRSVDVLALVGFILGSLTLMLPFDLLAGYLLPRQFGRSRLGIKAIDSRAVQQCIPEELLAGTLAALDRLQDDQPRRSSFVETIFHPVPSVENRRTLKSGGRPVARHAARMTLFSSWSCLGLLARVVHCNAGRPELWVMLRAD